MDQRVTAGAAWTVSGVGRNVAFIDGLRAVSILAVVLYHVGVPGFGGGFVGVDIFFVISGYLIINQISEGVRAGTFSTWNFYARRSLRILPAFILVLAVCTVAANVVLVSPQEFKDFGNQLLWSSMMLVNHHFIDRQGYFDTASDLKPLLNMWSLAVEEQFYVAAPFIIAFFLPRGIRRTAMTLAVLSLIGCLAISASSKPYAFFLAPFRAWEFIAGGAVAYIVPRLARANCLTLDLLALAGALAITGSIVGFDSASTYPSWRAMVPVFGSVAVLAIGMMRPGAIVAKLLTFRPLVGIGLVSYSWYLWHWPLLSFARISRFGKIALLPDAAAAVFGLLLAILTYFMVERPIKSNRDRIIAAFGDRRTFAIGVAACGVMTLAAASVLFISKPIAERNYAALNLHRVDTGAIYTANPCALTGADIADGDCTAILSGADYGVLLGDSHAETAYPTIADVAGNKGARLAMIVEQGCSPLWGAGLRSRLNPSSDCTDRTRESVLDLIRKAGHPPRFVVIKSYWIGLYADGLDDPAKTLRDGIETTITELEDSGADKIVIVEPTPKFPRSVPMCLLRKERHCGLPVTDMEAQRAEIRKVFDGVAASHPNVHLVDPATALCTDTFCPARMNEVTLYFDAHHLSADAEKLLSPLFEGVL